ncbi:hypothetical protein Tco_1055298 [Tanacetum coccineum]|uniref:Integrase catalytic domain-containing protein n=1 Tax=Tanacetum coccineum TaxID=301880 RepID=A0ABQ5GZ84_9ASTR
MHNNIWRADQEIIHQCFCTGRYTQWQSRLLRYIDKRPNGDALRKCILEGPYQPTTVTILVVPATADSLVVPERTTVETILTMSLENKAHYESEKEAMHLLLTGIGDEIYSTVDACKTAHKMWIAIERLQQVNEIRVERIAKNANPLALVAAASPYPDPYYQAPKSHKPYAPTSKQSSLTRSNASTKFKAKEIANSTIPPSEKPKRVKDFTYHKEKMLLRKQAEKGVQLQAEQSDWLADTDKEIDEQELEAHYNYMAKIQEVHTADLGTDSEPMEQNDQNTVECDDECVALANLIANLKLDVDENKKFQKQLKKENTSLAYELTECKSILEETSRLLGESNSIRDSCLVALQNKHTEFERFANLEKHSISLESLLQNARRTTENDTVCKKGVNVFRKERNIYLGNQDLKAQPARQETSQSNLPKTAMQAVRNTNVIKPGMYRIASSTTQTRAPQLNQTSRNTNPSVSTSTGVTHKANVSRPQPRSNQTKDKVVPNTSHVKFKKTEYLNDVNARTKKPKGVPTSSRKPKSQANKSVATPHKKTVASESTITNSKSYYRMLYKKTNKAWKCVTNSAVVMASKDLSSQTSTLQLLSKKVFVVIGLPKLKYVKDQLCSFLMLASWEEYIFCTLMNSLRRRNEALKFNPRKLKRNGIVEDENRTLVEGSAIFRSSKTSFILLGEAIAPHASIITESIIIPNHEKTAYHILNDRKKNP